MDKTTFTFNVRDMVEIAMLCALAIVLDRFLKIPLGPTGGSLNLSMVPIFFINLRHGWFKGFIAGGLVYGLITCLLDGYGMACYPLEYFVAFGASAVLGIFARYINNNFDNKKGIIISHLLVVLSVAVWATIRFFAASIDSVILYEYTWEAAFIYNLTYVYFSAIAVAVVTCGLLYLIIKLNKMYPTSYLKNKK